MFGAEVLANSGLFHKAVFMHYLTQGLALQDAYNQATKAWELYKWPEEPKSNDEDDHIDYEQEPSKEESEEVEVLSIEVNGVRSLEGEYRGMTYSLRKRTLRDGRVIYEAMVNGESIGEFSFKNAIKLVHIHIDAELELTQ